METELFGIVNGHTVLEGVLYRGGNIQPPGYLTIRERGVKRIICLKNDKDDSPAEILMEKARTAEAGLEWLHMPLKNNGRFSYDDIQKVPDVVAEIITGPATLVHCAHGADRTGVVIAVYRILRNNRTAEEAIQEMKRYGSAWYNWGMRHAVAEFAEHHQTGL